MLIIGFHPLMVTLLKNDASWVQQAFLVKQSDLAQLDQDKRYFTTASFKYGDTRPGGSRAINPPPQFTRNADLRVKGVLSGVTALGYGRYYSEAIDDNAQVINIRCGVPAFNSMTNFFTNFYDPQTGQLARTGRVDKGFYTFGLALGMIVQVLNWQLLAVHLLGTAFKFFTQIPSSKFYYMKPAMPLYWNAVQTILNQIAVNRGIVPRIGGTPELNNVGGGYDTWTDEDRGQMNRILPDIFDKTGQIDVYSMATRYQRIEQKRMKAFQAAGDSGTSDLASIVNQTIGTGYTDDKALGYKAYLASWVSAQGASQPAGTSNNSAGGATDGSGTNSVDSSTESIASIVDNNASFGDFLAGELDDGGAFASFRVNSTGSMNESFSSSVRPSEVENKINSTSSQARNMKFNLMDGNVGAGVVGETISAIAGATKNLVSGLADSMGISGLATLGGAAFVDIPKKWDNSTANLPRGNYTIDLVSPYGNPLSQLMNLHIPLAMLLAMALPLSTGKQSYTSPFLVELYDKGRCQTRMGMVDSLTVTRGTGNLGFNRDGFPMGISVSFSIIDLTSILHMPIAEGMSLATAAVIQASGSLGSVVQGAVATAIAPGVFDQDSAFSDYMAVLGAMGLQDQIYAMRRFKLNLTKAIADANSFTNASHMASIFGDTLPGRLMGIKYRGTAK